MPYRRNLCHYSIDTFVHTEPLTFDLANLLSNLRSHDEYLLQVSPKSLH